VLLAPGQAGKLQLSNVRATYTELGLPRPTAKIHPGDIYWLAFDAVNVQVDKQGRAYYGMALEVTDKAGKVWLKQEENKNPLVSDNSLGGNSLPIAAHLETGLDMPPGEYSVKLTVADKLGKSATTIQHKFEILKPDLALVRLHLSYDPAGVFKAPMVGFPGQVFQVNLHAVGFKRDTKTKQPNMTIETRILDDKKQPVLAQQDSTVINSNVAETANGVPLDFGLMLNRPGRFTVEVRATDQVAKKTATLTFPLIVLPNSETLK
jgi:hypothetical protein